METVPVNVFVGQLLGAGAFGSVCAALVRQDARRLVLKRPLDGDHDEIYYELEVLRGIGFHQAITSLEYFYDTGSRIGLLFERGICNLWDLASKVELTEDEIRGIFLDMHAALKYVHKRGYLHCDVKPDNIIVFEDGTVKLGDFGCAVAIQKGGTLNTCVGTTPYMAPAVLAQHKYVDRSIDFWSLAVTCLEVFFHYVPFDGWTRFEVYQNVIFRRLFTGSETRINWDLWETGRFFVPRLSLQPPTRLPGTSIVDNDYFKLGRCHLQRPIGLLFKLHKRGHVLIAKADSDKTTVSAKRFKPNEN